MYLMQILLVNYKIKNSFVNARILNVYNAKDNFESLVKYKNIV